MRSKQKSTTSKPRRLRAFQGFAANYPALFAPGSPVFAPVSHPVKTPPVGLARHNCVQLPEPAPRRSPTTRQIAGSMPRLRRRTSCWYAADPFESR